MADSYPPGRLMISLSGTIGLARLPVLYSCRSALPTMVKNPPPSPLADDTIPPSREAILQAAESAMALASIDASGRQSYVSPAFCALVGWNAEELLGHSAPFVYWPPEDQSAITNVLAQAAQGQTPPGGVELRFVRKSGERFFVQVIITPLTEGGVTAGWLTARR